MIFGSLLGAVFSVGSVMGHSGVEIHAGEELEVLQGLAPGAGSWVRQQDGVYLGHFKDGSKVRIIGQAGMHVRQEELRSALAQAELSGDRARSGHEWMRKELAMLDQSPITPSKATQNFQNPANICGVPMEASGSFSADLIPFATLWIAGGASSVRVDSPFAPHPPVASWVSHGWISHGVWVPSVSYSVGQFDDFFTVIFSPPVTGSTSVPMDSTCEIQIDATISVACLPAAPNSNSYFTVTRWQTCEGVVAGSPIN